MSPADTWRALFQDGLPAEAEDPAFYSHFTPSRTPAHREILRVLREEPENTISICALGPLTNLALAAAEDPETFLRAKDVVVMGGAVECPGNVTPVAEFNTYADAVATARVFALTSPSPSSTMPSIPQNKSALPPYPARLSKPLRLSLFPLDITTPHLLNKSYFLQRIQPHLRSGSPLAAWIHSFMAGTYRQIESMVDTTEDEAGLSLHDPMTVWYMLTQSDPAWTWAQGAPEDIRVETSGQWTHGMHVSDRRGRKRAGEGTAVGVEADAPDPDAVPISDVPGDTFGWLSSRRGNRIYRCAGSPGEDEFAPFLMERLFGKP